MSALRATETPGRSSCLQSLLSESRAKQSDQQETDRNQRNADHRPWPHLLVQDHRTAYVDHDEGQRSERVCKIQGQPGQGKDPCQRAHGIEE